jgi:hypothetical protein
VRERKRDSCARGRDGLPSLPSVGDRRRWAGARDAVRGGGDPEDVRGRRDGTCRYLADTPRQIATITRRRGNRELRSKPEKGAWCAGEILAHLRACADVWGTAIARMIAEDRPTIRHVSPRAWIRKTDHVEADFGASLEAFTQQRDGLVRQLLSLDTSGWSRVAIVTSSGRQREVTVLIYATRIRDHELQHLEQLERTLQGTLRSPSR